jgi:hypothetical protein
MMTMMTRTCHQPAAARAASAWQPLNSGTPPSSDSRTQATHLWTTTMLHGKMRESCRAAPQQRRQILTTCQGTTAQTRWVAKAEQGLCLLQGDSERVAVLLRRCCRDSTFLGLSQI